MGTAVRFFRLTDEGRVERVPTARIMRWHDGTERAPLFAGREVRLIQVTVEAVGRTPRRILSVLPWKTRFLPDGRMDGWRQKVMAVNALELHERIEMEPGTRKGNIVDALPRIEKRRLDEERSFALSEEVAAEVRAMVLGRR